MAQAEPVPPIVLSFAASDPTGGAGIQADILTLASLGCHPLSVITAVTVQDTVGVEGVLAIDAGWIADQARAVLEDMPVAAFKVGLTGSAEAIAAITEIVSDYPDIPLVVDPVLMAVVARIPTGTGPHEIAFLPDPEGHLQAWVGNFRDHSLTLVDIDPDSPRRFTAVANLR